MSNNRFQPVKGLEETILRMPYKEGYLYFATDTKMIYLDANKQNKIPMGGTSSTGSGIILGTRSISFEESQEEVLVFTLDQVNIDYLPSIDAIILNEPDGSFFKVINISEDNTFEAQRLTVAGGSGGGGSEEQAKLTLEVISGLQTGQTFVYGQSANIVFKGNVDNEDVKVIYTIEIINDYAGSTSSKTYGPFTEDKDIPYTFDLGSVLPLGTNTVRLSVSSDNANSVKRVNYTLVNCVEMKLERSENFNPLTVFKGQFNFYCIAAGANLTKSISIYIDDALIPSLTVNNITVARQEQQFTIPSQTHGMHKITAVMTCAESAASQSISYNICCIESGNDASIIWYNEESTPSSIIEHDILNVEYMVYNPLNTTNIEVHYYINGTEISTSPQNISYTPTSWEKWRVTGYELGDNVLVLRTGTTSISIPVQVKKDTIRNLNVVTSGLYVNLEAEGRSNNENPQSRGTWKCVSSDGTKETEVTFNNFNWYNNGWKTEDDKTFLRISNGASIEVPFNVLNSSALTSSVAVELMFKIRNIRNYSTLIKTEVEDPTSENPTIVKKVSSTDGVWGSYYNNNIGFCLGTQEAFFKTRDQLVSGRYKEDEIVHVSFVVEAAGANSNTNKLIYIYINGINSGIAKYSTTTDSLAANCQKLIINSDYCDVDLYKLRVYKTNLTPQYVVQNFLADFNDAALYDMNNDIVDYTNGIPSINYIKMLEYNSKHPESLLQPYMVIETTDASDELPYFKKESSGSNWIVNIEFVNPTLDYEFENNLWTTKDFSDRGYKNAEEMYIYSCPSYKATGVDLNVQGTSSQGYPIRNYKAKFKKAKSWEYTSPKMVDADGKPIKVAKGGTLPSGVKVPKKWHMDSFIGENKTTLKADYMDSSGTHNTGFANLITSMYTKHPLNDYPNLPEGTDTSILRTNVYGFPILMFHKNHLGEYRFLGRYNYNLDKGCDDTLGFCDFGDDTFVDVTSLVNADNFNYKKLYIDIEGASEPQALESNAVYDPSITYYRLDEGADSYALNPDYDSSNPYSRQYLPWSAAAECWEMQQNQGGRCSFAKADFDEVGPDGLLTVMQDYEYRYHIDADSIDNAVAGPGVKLKPDGEVFKDEAAINAFMLKKLSRFEKLVEWLVSTDSTKATGLPLEQEVRYNDSNVFTEDTAEYRLAKFKFEFDQHLDKEYCLIYWIMTELLLCYDSRGKNLMMATWGPHEKGGNDIWYPLFYDIDTQLGVNNSGVPYWDYYEEASNNGTFSTPDSVLWVNIQKCFANEIKTKYDSLAGTKLTAQRLNNYYSFNPEVTLSKAMEGYRPMIIHNVDEYQKYIAPSITGYIDTAGTTSYTDYFYYCLQGTRELQRALFLRNRFNYIDSMWQAGTYSKTQAKQGIQTRFDANDGSNTSDHYLNIEPSDEDKAAGYVYAQYGTEPLDFTLDYNITPFLKQYVSYYYDDTASPITYASDGETVVVPMLDSKREELLNMKQKLQQLVYWGGGEYISSLGDLSEKYLDQLTIAGAKRLTDLIVGREDTYDETGNVVSHYFNNMLNSSSFSPDDAATKQDKDGNTITNPNAKTLLQKVVLSNLGKLDGTLDFSGSEKLKELRALNTQVSSFILADGVQIEKLYLPKTITNLILKEPTSLTGILSDCKGHIETVQKYEVATVTEEEYNAFLNGSSDIVYYLNTVDGYKRCDDENYFKVTTDGEGNIISDERLYDKSRTYYILVEEKEMTFAPGLYLEGLTDLTEIKDTSAIQLSTLDIIGGNMGYDSYTLLNRAVQIKQKMINNTSLANSYNRHLRINLENVDWTPYRQVKSGEIPLDSSKYYLLNDHDMFELYEKVSNEYLRWDLNVLNGKVYEYNEELFTKHSQDITNLDMFDTFINDYKAAKTIYDQLVDKDSYDSNSLNYFQNNDIYAQGPTLAKLTGTIYINNDAEHPIDEAELKNYYHDSYYEDLEIHVANITKALVTKFVEIDEITGQEYVWDTLKYSAGTREYPELTTIIGSKLNYDFRGWSQTYYSQEALDAMTDEEIKNIVLTNESIQNIKFADANDNIITLYAIYTVHSYSITYLDGDNTTVVETVRVPSGEYIPLPKTNAYKDDSSLDLYSTYALLGYSRLKDGTELDVIALNPDDSFKLNIKSNQDLTLYPVFKETSVRNNVLDVKYLNIGSAGNLYLKDSSYKFKGKIVLPNTINGVAVKSISNRVFENQTEITHVFLEDPATSQLNLIDEYAFSQNSSLKYVELPANNYVDIYRRAFEGCWYLFDESINTELIKEFFKHVSTIGDSAFYDCRYGFVNGVYLYGNIRSVGDSAFYDLRFGLNYIQIGDENNYITPSSTSLSFGSQIFSTVFGGNIKNITIYCPTETTTNWASIIQNNFGIPSDKLGTINYIN